MKKIVAGILLCFCINTWSMEKPKVPMHEQLKMYYKNDYPDWLQRWHRSHSATNLAWYLSLLVYQEIDSLAQVTKKGKLVLAKQIDWGIMPFEIAVPTFKFDTTVPAFKESAKESFLSAVHDLARLNLTIKHLEGLKNEVEQERKMKSKL